MISIVVPVYNAARWVEGCVRSIAGQEGFEELCEVLLVDDGSSDGSGGICRRLAAEHANVRCLSEANSGPATARNLGMSHARGEYVWFVDADDQIAPDALWLLANCIERNRHPDVVCFNYRYVTEVGHQDAVNFEREQVVEPAIDLVASRAKLYAWNRIYRMEAVKGLRWPDGLVNTEDFYFTLMALARTRRLVTLPQVLYYYNCANPASTLRDRSRGCPVCRRAHEAADVQCAQRECERAAVLRAARPLAKIRWPHHCALQADGAVSRRDDYEPQGQPLSASGQPRMAAAGSHPPAPPPPPHYCPLILFFGASTDQHRFARIFLFTRMLIFEVPTDLHRFTRIFFIYSDLISSNFINL